MLHEAICNDDFSRNALLHEKSIPCNMADFYFARDFDFSTELLRVFGLKSKPRNTKMTIFSQRCVKLKTSLQIVFSYLQHGFE